jgi:uncharacterized membrane-anchored protein YjiN (DUF445 family)
MKNKIGQISLLSTLGGLTVTQICIHVGWLQGYPWTILAAGFEAGTVGGLADWFAVSALFREIPIPIVRRHTNIIVKNRRQLTEGVVDLVTNRWLSPDVIREKLSDVPIAEALIKMLQEPQNQSRAIDFLRDFLGRFADSLDKPEIAQLLQKILKDQIEGIDIAMPLGRWLEDTIRRGEHHQLWHMILAAAQRSINEASTREMLVRKVKGTIEEYKDEGILKKLFVSIGEIVGGVDANSVVSKIVMAVNEFINEAKNNPSHPARQRFDNSVLEFAQKLANGDVDAHATINNFKRKLADNADANEIIRGLLRRFKSTMIAQLKNNETPFMTLLVSNLQRLLMELESDEISQQKIDVWMRETITELINKYHHEIGNMVRSSLSKLDDIGLVNQIEEKVGNDLQYIRLNGAVVGGLAGILISLVKLLLLKP